MASSRVGVRMRAWMPFLPGRRFSKMGRANPPVLPEPV